MSVLPTFRPERHERHESGRDLPGEVSTTIQQKSQLKLGGDDPK
jgi:hypothetical protein